MQCRLRFPMVVILLCWLGASVAQGSASVQESPVGNEAIRGVTISTHRAGQEWGDVDVIVPTLREVKETGANWVAIHPYASISGDGEVRWRRWSADEIPKLLRVPIEQAKLQGLRVMIKPHLAYWGSPFSWRGEIAFDSEEQWQRFFATYGAWIEAVARATADADFFVVGTELDLTVQRPEWATLLGRVRAHTEAPLTFASNWTDFEQVPWWSELDAIGIQAYFPVSDEERPPREQVEAFWQRRMKTLARFARRVGRPVLFTEIGYSRTWHAAQRPWLAQTDEQAAEELQLMLYEVALRAIERESEVIGSFLWKWFPEPQPVGNDFQAASPAVRRLLQDVWQVDGESVGASQ